MTLSVRLHNYLFFFSMIVAIPALATDSGQKMSLSAALGVALGQNPNIAQLAAKADAESSAVMLQYAPANPRLGFMREVNMDLLQQEMGPMNSWRITQELMFPTKYFSMGSAQSARADAARASLEAKRLEVREKVISTFFGLHSARSILSLLEAQRETIREIARIAEARRATGGVPQQDEMKAHVEQTMIENEIIMQKQEVEEMEAMLNALLDRDPRQPIVLETSDLKIPIMTVAGAEVPQRALRGSRMIQAERAMVSEAETMKSLALQSFAPDFMLSYRQPFSQPGPKAFEFEVQATIPLWFLVRQSSELSSARSRAGAAEKSLSAAIRETQANVRGLIAKVESLGQVLKIYETSLIPQATSSLNSSRSAYSTGRTGFIELLDSERSLYSVRIEFYRTLAKFAASMSALERVAGVSLSTLPFGETGESP